MKLDQNAEAAFWGDNILLFHLLYSSWPVDGFECIGFITDCIDIDIGFAIQFSVRIIATP
jgi:hypothetical protein